MAHSGWVTLISSDPDEIVKSLPSARTERKNPFRPHILHCAICQPSLKFAVSKRDRKSPMVPPLGSLIVSHSN